MAVVLLPVVSLSLARYCIFMLCLLFTLHLYFYGYCSVFAYKSCGKTAQGYRTEIIFLCEVATSLLYFVDVFTDDVYGGPKGGENEKLRSVEN